MFWPCETRTSTCRSFATISSGLYRFLAIAVLLDVKDIPQVGPLQWGWIRPVRSLQPLGPIQNNSDLAQGPLPIRPSKVRRKLPHVAAELIGWENSDAQDHRVFRCRRFVRDWVRSMGGLARQSACFPLDRSGD